MPKKLHLITAVVQRKIGDAVVDAALKAGATGATFFYAEGTGTRQRLGAAAAQEISGSKRAVFIVTDESHTDAVFDAVVKAAKLEDPGQGFACVQDVLKAVGFIAPRR
jgi:nitrogen regulatory protein P-II 1